MNRRARVALATCAAFPELTDDDPLLLAELRRRGLDAQPAVWDDQRVDWDSFELVVLRSTWDYTARRERFLEWARSVPRLLNAPDVVAWNTDKRYLAELPLAVETTFLAPGDGFRAPAPELGEYVVKPTVSAGSRDTARYHPDDLGQAREHAEQLLQQGRHVMLQPYLHSVDTHGETALIFFAGRFSHAIRKGQMLVPGARASSDVLFLEENISARQPEPDELAAAELILDSLRWDRGELLYARVDLIRDERDDPRVVELELAEPSLFLSFAEDAPKRLAEAIIARL